MSFIRFFVIGFATLWSIPVGIGRGDWALTIAGTVGWFALQRVDTHLRVQRIRREWPYWPAGL